MSEYVQQAKTVKISAMSKATVQINGSYFSFSYSEERELPEDQSRVNLEKEREYLWEDLNSEVDNQIEQTIQALKKV